MTCMCGGCATCYREDVTVLMRCEHCQKPVLVPESDPIGEPVLCRLCEASRCEDCRGYRIIGNDGLCDSCAMDRAAERDAYYAKFDHIYEGLR